MKQYKYRVDDYRSSEEDSIITSIISQPFNRKLGLEFQSANEAGIRLQLDGHEPIYAGSVRLGFYEQGAAEVLNALQAFVAVTKANCKNAERK